MTFDIIEKTENDFGGHVSTGVVGIQHLMRTLTDYGRGDLALRMSTDTTYPSWGYMVKNGATTIWELWNGDTGDPANIKPTSWPPFFDNPTTQDIST